MTYDEDDPFMPTALQAWNPGRRFWQGAVFGFCAVIAVVAAVAFVISVL